MSVFHSIVLWQFNDCGVWTHEAWVRRTELDADEVKRVLQSFTKSKIKLLAEASNGDLTVNDAFANDKKKLKIPVAIQKINAAATAQAQAAVQEDRSLTIDAGIVRIMKSRKTMEHALLVAEVIEQLQHRFKPEPKKIKERIEDLINREYIERSANAPGTYVYLA